MPTVTTSFIDLQDEHKRIRTYAFKDSPEFCETGASQDFTQLEVLALLSRCGLTDDEAQQRLELILRKRGMHRLRFQLSAAQFAAVSDTFIEPIPEH